MIMAETQECKIGDEVMKGTSDDLPSDSGHDERKAMARSGRRVDMRGLSVYMKNQPTSGAVWRS